MLSLDTPRGLSQAELEPDKKMKGMKNETENPCSD
jgi:hypothetical protein